MSNFNTETTKLIKGSKPEATEEDQIISSLFVADSGQAAEEFEQQKQTEIEANLQ